VQVPVSIVLDGSDDAVRNAVTAVCVLERKGRSLPEAVVLQAGQRAGSSLGGRPVNDSGFDTTVRGPKPEVSVCR